MKKRFLSSSQFASLCGITKNTLIWYEKKGLLAPAFVGENGYHYYTYDQYFDVDLIKSMKWTDMTLEECGEYIRSRSSDSYMQMLIQQQTLLSRKLEIVRRRKEIMDMTIQDCLILRSRYSEKPQIVKQAPMYVLGESIDRSDMEGYTNALQRLFSVWRRCHAVYGLASSMLTRTLLPRENILSGQFNAPSQLCLRVGAQVPDPACRVLPGGEYAVIYHSGPVSRISESYRQLLDFIARSGAEVSGDAIECDFVNHLSIDDPDYYVKEILIPFKRK